jgi:hypothetical protein
VKISELEAELVAARLKHGDVDVVIEKGHCAEHICTSGVRVDVLVYGEYGEGRRYFVIEESP